jgi:RNA polymerase sigma-70 factor, ECF subfamily
MAISLIAPPIQLSQPAVSKSPAPSITDEELMLRVRRGDEAALGQLLQRYWTSLVQYAIRFLNDIDAAEDAVQEAFVRLWARRSGWVSRGSPRSYLYCTVKNLVLQELEKRSVRRRWREAQPADGSLSFSILEDIEADRLERDLDSAIRKLPPRRQEILILARFHGLTYAQIADVMDISRQTVANQLSAALRELREALSSHRTR